MIFRPKIAVLDFVATRAFMFYRDIMFITDNDSSRNVITTDGKSKETQTSSIPSTTAELPISNSPATTSDVSKFKLMPAPSVHDIVVSHNPHQPSQSSGSSRRKLKPRRLVPYTSLVQPQNVSKVSIICMEDFISLFMV